MSKFTSQTLAQSVTLARRAASSSNEALDKALRRRNSWQFLVWSFMALETLRDSLNLDGYRGGAGEEGSDANGIKGDIITAADGGDIDGYVADFENFDNSSGSFVAAPVIAATVSFSGIDHAGDALYYQSLALARGHSGETFGGSVVSTANSNAGGSTTVITTDPQAPYIPQLSFFDGFNPFATQLGLSADFYGIASNVDPAAKGLISTALQFSGNALMPIGVWETLGDFNASKGFSHSDGFNTQWLMQAAGYTEHTQAHSQAASNVDNGLVVQWGDSATKTLTNAAALVDGQDWTGTLWVKGNYYEFNTIVQVNVIWNNDTVVIEHTGSAGSGAAAERGSGVVNTGDNKQANYAQIIDYANSNDAPLDTHGAQQLQAAKDLAASSLPPVAEAEDINSHQLIVGGKNDYYGVIQTNSIVEVDKLDFSMLDKIVGDNTKAAFEGFADLRPGGHIQHNDSYISTTGRSGANLDSLDTFIKSHSHSKISIVHGDYYEFNTIFQINVISDNNTINKSYGHGSNAYGGGLGVIASGGNIELNTAGILKNDHADDLYVGGVYSQYNLVLQVSALQNNTTITQISSVTHDGIGDLGHVGSIYDTHGSVGGNGANGGTSIAIPSALEELSLRGMTVDHSL